jgi:hypothetical protein
MDVNPTKQKSINLIKLLTLIPWKRPRLKVLLNVEAHPFKAVLFDKNKF